MKTVPTRDQVRIILSSMHRTVVSKPVFVDLPFATMTKASHLLNKTFTSLHVFGIQPKHSNDLKISKNNGNILSKECWIIDL